MIVQAHEPVRPHAAALIPLVWIVASLGGLILGAASVDVYSGSGLELVLTAVFLAWDLAPWSFCATGLCWFLHGGLVGLHVHRSWGFVLLGVALGFGMGLLFLQSQAEIPPRLRHFLVAGVPIGCAAGGGVASSLVHCLKSRGYLMVEKFPYTQSESAIWGRLLGIRFPPLTAPPKEYATPRIEPLRWIRRCLEFRTFVQLLTAFAIAWIAQATGVWFGNLVTNPRTSLGSSLRDWGTSLLPLRFGSENASLALFLSTACWWIYPRYMDHPRKRLGWFLVLMTATCFEVGTIAAGRFRDDIDWGNIIRGPAPWGCAASGFVASLLVHTVRKTIAFQGDIPAARLAGKVTPP